MPDRPLKFCEEPGCRQRVELGYCKAHAPKKKRPPHLHGSGYERKRAAFLKANPYCKAKGPRCTTWARELDHIVPQNTSARSVRPSNMGIVF